MDDVEFGRIILPVDGVFATGMDMILECIEPVVVARNLHSSETTVLSHLGTDEDAVESDVELKLLPLTGRPFEFVAGQI